MIAAYSDDIPEIRLVPFKRDGFKSDTIEDIQNDFINDGEVWYTKNIIAPENTLLLFRTGGLVFAAALLDRIDRQANDKYPFCIHHKNLTLFNPPITSAALAEINPGFGDGTRSTRKLDIGYKKEILDLLTVSTIQSAPESDMGQRHYLTETEYEQIIKSRIGQGLFRHELLKRDKVCRVCGLNITSLLYASHIKPWKDSNNEERLDPYNGFVLCSLHNDL